MVIPYCWSVAETYGKSNNEGENCHQSCRDNDAGQRPAQPKILLMSGHDAIAVVQTLPFEAIEAGEWLHFSLMTSTRLPFWETVTCSSSWVFTVSHSKLCTIIPLLLR